MLLFSHLVHSHPVDCPTGNHFRVSGAKTLAECLMKSSYLIELRLGGLFYIHVLVILLTQPLFWCLGTYMGEEGLMHLSESLKNAQYLEHLSLWGLFFLYSPWLCVRLKVMSSFQTGNCLGTGNLVGVRNLLLNIPSLTHLDLWSLFSF